MTTASDVPTPVAVPDASAPAESGRGSRLFSGLVAFGAGVIVAMVGTVAHINILQLGPVSIPAGLILALFACLALMVGVRLIFVDRATVIAAGAGIVLTVALFTFAGPGGAVLIGQSLISLLWTLGPVLIAVIVIAWPRFTRPAATIAPAPTGSVQPSPYI